MDEERTLDRIETKLDRLGELVAELIAVDEEPSRPAP